MFIDIGRFAGKLERRTRSSESHTAKMAVYAGLCTLVHPCAPKKEGGLRAGSWKKRGLTTDFFIRVQSAISVVQRLSLRLSATLRQAVLPCWAGALGYHPLAPSGKLKNGGLTGCGAPRSRLFAD